MSSEDRSEIVLTGLDGSNPLAFLAALGTLRTLTRTWPDRNVQMAWRVEAGAWRPVLCLTTPAMPNEIVAALEPPLTAMHGHAAFTFEKNLKMPKSRFREFAESSVRVAHQSRDDVTSEFAAAYSCDGCVDKNGENAIQDTDFRTMSGAGHQHFLQFMDFLSGATSTEHLKTALFDAWPYMDTGPSMRWDPQDDRRYAMRWDEPSGDPIRTVRGANRLAIEGIALFPSMPVRGNLATTGFSEFNRKTFLTWPIWTPAVSLLCCRSLLALKKIQSLEVDRNELAFIGIVEVFRSQRIRTGKFRNFTPAQAV